MPKSHYKRRTPEAVEEDIKNGRYSTPGALSTALAQVRFAEVHIKRLRKIGEAHFTVKNGEEQKSEKRQRNVGKRGHGDKNGAGESLTVTMLRVLMNDMMRSVVMRLLAKAIDEGKTLPDLYDDMKNVLKVLP